MSSVDVIALLPLIILALTVVVLLLGIAVARHNRFTVSVTLIGPVLAFIVLGEASTVAPRAVTTLLVVDHYAIFYLGLIFAAAFSVALLSSGYLAGRRGLQEEFYVLLLLATLGAAVLVVSNHFAAFFLGLELLSVALYVLIAYAYTNRRALEAGLKYLILAGAASAFLLFGMALIYAELGTMEFARMASTMATRTDLHQGVVLTGLALLLTGVGFKLAIVPFHMWTPDVYEGAPAPVTAFVATVSKGAMFALLLRYFMQSSAQQNSAVFSVLSAIAIASMFVGNLLALLQQNVKRVLAYSSIAHLGYLLVAFLAGGTLAAETVTYYLVAYFVTMLGAFGVVTVLSDPQQDADRITDYRGLFWRSPWLAGVFTATLLSLAGIPLTAGFVGKFYVLAAGVTMALWPLVVILAINSAIGLFYYLRIVVAMYTPSEEFRPSTVTITTRPLPITSSVLLTVLLVLLIWLGVYPAPVIRLIQGAMVSLV